MTKVLIIVGSIVALLIVMITVITMVNPPKSSNPNNIPSESTSPTPPGSLSPTLPLSIDSSTPVNNASGIKIDSPLSLHFTKDVDINSASITLSPSTGVKISYSNRVLDIIPDNSLQKNTKYRLDVSIPLNKFSYSLFFTTGNDILGGTAPGEAQVQMYDNSVRQTNPSLFLSNKVPYSNGLFQIALGPFKTSPSSHYSFVVTFNGSDRHASQDSLKSWLQSLQLTDTQIQSLDISYK